MNDTTHATMARVAMRAAIWSALRTMFPDATDADIDRLTNSVVAHGQAVAAEYAKEQELVK